MTVSLFSVVTGDNDRDSLEAYLYAHTKLVASITVERRTAYLLRTTAEAGDPGHEYDHCGYLARYQVGRLQSGLYGDRTTGRTLSDACDILHEWLDHEVSLQVR